MAAKEALRKLEEELQCAICLGTYADPKLLNCNHVFCADCLPKLVGGDNSLTCPTCRKVTPIPGNKVRGLQPAFRINTLLEIQKSLRADLPRPSTSPEEVKTEAPLPPLSTVSYCTDHPTQELKLFCEKCEKLVCIECAVDGAEHYTHKPAMLKKTCDRYKTAIRASLEPLKKQLSTISDALSKADVKYGEITQQQEAIQAVLHDTARQLHQAVDARTTELISQLHQHTQTKLKSLSSQRDDIETTFVTYQCCSITVEEELNTSRDQDIVIRKEPIVEKIQSLTSSFQPDLLKVSVSANLKFTSGDVLSSALSYGAITESEVLPDPSKCFIIAKDLGSLEVEQKTSVLVRTMDSNREEYEEEIKSLECEFISELTGTKSVISFERQEKSLYKFSFIPTVKGRHQLNIRIGSQHISGSPVTFPVRKPIEKIDTPIYTITDVCKPWGVAISKDGEIVVTEHGNHSVSVFSPRGQRLQSIGTPGSEEGQFNKPRGVAVDENGDIFVADSKNYRIQKFTMDGKFLKAIGSGDTQFKDLRGLAFNAFNSKLYVIDGNHIIVLERDLSFVSSFGKFGLKSKEHAVFNKPVDIACDNSGQLYVTDFYNGRIVILTPEGELLKVIEKSSMRKGLTNPTGVAVDSDGFLYYNRMYYNSQNRIIIVTSEGNLVNELKGSYSGFTWEATTYLPFGLAIDDSGVVYACEYNSNQITLF